MRAQRDIEIPLATQILVLPQISHSRVSDRDSYVRPGQLNRLRRITQIKCGGVLVLSARRISGPYTNIAALQNLPVAATVLVNLQHLAICQQRQRGRVRRR